MRNLKKNMLVLLSLVMAPVMGFAGTSETKKTLEDTAITGMVKAKLLADSDVSGMDINVTTNNGVVFLKGNVDTVFQAERAVELANSIDDVADVNSDQIAVKDSHQVLTDTYITAKVKGVLLRESMLHKEDHFKNVKVETKDGVVHLSGTTPDKANSERASTLASNVKGVKKVASHIKVE